MSTKEIEAYIVNVETEASLAAPLENQNALIKVTAQSGESTGEVDFIDGFFRGRLELLRLAADEFSLLAGFCDIALHELTSEGGISLACLLQVLRQTNRIRQPKVAGNRLESVRYLQAG